MVDKSVLVIIGVFNISGHHEQVLGQLKHVIYVAGFTVAVGALTVQNIVLAEMLPLAVSAGGVCMVIYYHLPEYFRCLKVLGSIHLLTVNCLAIKNNVAVESAYHLGDGCIGMPVVEDIRAVCPDKLKQGILIKGMSGNSVLIVACKTV